LGRTAPTARLAVPDRPAPLRSLLTELTWNSTVGWTNISPDCKNGRAETEQGCGIFKRLVTAAPQETRAGCQKSLGMSSTGEKRRHGLQKQLIDE
jgi:hypothetical protein